MLKKSVAVDKCCAMRLEVKGIYFIREFNANNLCERNKKQIEQSTTAIPHENIFIVITLHDTH